MDYLDYSLMRAGVWSPRFSSEPFGSDPETHDFVAWLVEEFMDKKQLELRRADTSVLHQLWQACNDGKVLWPQQNRAQYKYAFINSYPRIKWELFLIHHDWTKVVSDKDLTEGMWRPPYRESVFEFAVAGGGRVVVFVAEEYEETDPLTPIYLNIFVRGPKDHWVNFGVSNVAKPTEDEPVIIHIFKLIQATCIMMECQVAEPTEVIRAPYRMNSARIKNGKLPIHEHRVLKLRQRIGIVPHETEALHDKRRSPRLHLRRGHWRHFDKYKTWIKWMYVGDADLGFIDKEYRI